ncbi:MAG TPA: EAL domain-containing protein [Acetobacteraceae bacterium]|nr:EAL domain-containing protein [Acetobacteraceae bacterium]
MDDLWIYRAVSTVVNCRYRYKIMLVAFIGTHIPLLALIGYFFQRAPISPRLAMEVLGVALVATLAGTVLTLFALDQLLRPIIKTSRALRAYATRRTLPSLPTHYTDEVGTLMGDAVQTLGKLDATLAELTSFDQVTGLPNREKLLRDLDAALACHTARGALCVLTVRNYDALASAFGQQASDTLIRRFARAFERAVGAGVPLARLAAHRFAFWLNGSDPDRVAPRAGAALRALRREISSDGLRFVPQLSCGVALYPEDGTDAASLVNNAVSAGATAAPGAEAGPVFFSPACRDAVRRRLSLEQELRRALEHDEFVLHFQPVVDVRANRIVAAEALIRWRHPERGLLLPGSFLPIAETSGILGAIERWVLRTAARHLHDWLVHGFDAIRLAVNLSASEIHAPDTVALIRRTLAAEQVDPGRLEIEVTETVAMTDQARTRAVFDQLRALGIGVTIDDFGTGYSNLSYLLNLPFDKLKIAREFVSGIDTASNSRAICRALIELAHGLGIAVVAEGIETLAEMRTLRAMGCTLFQGFHFARPMRAADFAVLLQAQAAKPFVVP